MKKLITLAFLLITSICFAQNFSYSRIYYLGGIRKLKGTITLTSSSINITGNGTNSTYKLRKVYENDEIKKWKGQGHGEDVFVRVTFKNPKTPTKQDPMIVLVEIKDTFADSYSKVLYYVKKNE